MPLTPHFMVPLSVVTVSRQAITVELTLSQISKIDNNSLLKVGFILSNMTV